MDNGEYIENTGPAAIADAIASSIASDLKHETRDIVIAVPGGSTPFPIFEELVKYDLDFSRLVVWPTDDRIVPEDHPASNTGKIRAIFEPVGARVKPLKEDAEIPDWFDLVWLGMGADGHIASLFPNTDPKPLDPQLVRRLTPDPLPPEAPFDRITLTIPALSRTMRMIFVIRGDEKRAVFEAADEGESDLPIARLLAEANVLTTHITCFT